MVDPVPPAANAAGHDDAGHDDDNDEREAAASVVPRGAFDRRSALVAGSAVLVGLAATQACKREASSSATKTQPPEQTDATPTDARAFVPVLAAIAARLVPSDESGPGAAEAGVDAFFAKALEDQRLAAVHPLLKRGCAFLMKAARVEQNRAFVDLDAAAQDELIRRLVEGKMRPDGFSGPTFVRVALALTLEGFLGDPRHGGNKDAVGWRFVGFSPDGRGVGPAPSAPSLKVVP